MSRCWLDVPYLLRCKWLDPGLRCNYIPLSAFLMTRDLSWLTSCSVSFSLFNRLSYLWGFFSYGSDVLLQLGVASSRGVPG